MNIRLILPLLLAFTVTCQLFGEWDPTEAYNPRDVRGWKVLVNKELTEDHPELLDRVIKLLDEQLAEIERVVPEKAVDELRKIPFWLEYAHPKHPCACYHVSPDWLRSNDMNPEKAGGVEIANAKNFLSWTKQQPWMVLHELAHGYHFRHLGERDKDVLKAFNAAKESGKYESVKHYNGRDVRHYALTNNKEYFAEATEAYFGKNDFYPFNREELKAFDPEGYAVIEKTWGVTEERNEAKEAGKEPEPAGEPVN